MPARAPLPHCAMTIVDVPQRPVTSPGGRRSPRRSARGRTAVAVALAGAAVATMWWWSHPSVFAAAGGELGLRTERLAPAYVSMGGEDAAGRATVLDGEPRVRTFGGQAQAEVLLCRGASIGIVTGERAGDRCVGPAVAAQQGLEWDQVVLKVTPVDPGTVVVFDGVDLTYRAGVQRGTQHTGPSGVIVFPDR